MAAPSLKKNSFPREVVFLSVMILVKFCSNWNFVKNFMKLYIVTCEFLI